jgi:hypothetical protein
MATKATKAKATTTKKKKGLSAKQEAERERLEALIVLNEARLASNSAAGGQPLTEKQIETTRQIVQTQREKLQEILALL